MSDNNEELLSSIQDIVLENATLKASDARYQARVRELEVFIKFVRDNNDDAWTRAAEQALSPTTPDTALQRIVLEARIAQNESDQIHAGLCTCCGWSESAHEAVEKVHEDIVEAGKELREQLAALEGDNHA